MNIVNLTPHDLTIICKDGSTIEVKRSGLIARAKTTEKVLYTTPEGVEVKETIFGDPIIVTEDGEEKPISHAINPMGFENVLYVVSRLFKQAIGDRHEDVLCPGMVVRDDDGQPVGCIGLSL